MGVSTTTNTVIDAGDGTTTDFAFGFYFFRKVDLYVYIYDLVAKTISQKVMGTDYVVNGTPNSSGLYPNGGTVSFSGLYGAPPSTQAVFITRDPIELQNFALLQNGVISSNAIVQQFDYVTLLVQALADKISRCIKVPQGFTPTFNPNLPAAVIANTLLGINSSANGMVLSAGGGGGGGAAGGMAVNPAAGTTSLAAGSPINQQYIPCNASGSAFTVTLPASNSGMVGQTFVVKKTDSSANAVTIATSGGDVILGTSSVSSVSLDYQGKSYTFVCRAAGAWDVI